MTQEQSNAVKSIFDKAFNSTQSKDAAKMLCELMYNNAKNIYLKELEKELDMCKAFSEIDKTFSTTYYNVVGKLRITWYEENINSCDEILNFIFGL